MIHNALVSSSEYNKIVLMSKIINNNENLKICKEILNEKIYLSMKKSLNIIDENITSISQDNEIEKSLNHVMKTV